MMDDSQKFMRALIALVVFEVVLMLALFLLLQPATMFLINWPSLLGAVLLFDHFKEGYQCKGNCK